MPNDDPGVINLDDARAAKQRRDELGAIAAAHASGRSRAHAVSSRNQLVLRTCRNDQICQSSIRAWTHKSIEPKPDLAECPQSGQPLDPLRLGGGDRIVV